MNQKAYSTNFPEIYRGVVEDTNDPDHLGRCKVRVPGIHGEKGRIPTDILPWAVPIVLTPLSDSRGSINLPDKGDWVWVLFEGARKEYPLYFGGMYSNKDDVKPDFNTVTLYTEENNAITYDRKGKTYTINIGDNTITLSQESIVAQSGNNSVTVSPDKVDIVGDTTIQGSLNVDKDVTIVGDLLVDGEAYFSKNIRVKDIVYCKQVITSGGALNMLLEGYDTASMTQEEFDALLESLGIDGMSDYLAYALAFLGMEEGGVDNAALTAFLGVDPSTTPWCAAFVSACLKEAGMTQLGSNSVSGLLSQAQSLGLYQGKNSYTPKAGDIFIEKSNGASHTGFVTGVNSDGTINVISGNSNAGGSAGKVHSAKMKISNPSLSGFIRMS